MTRKATPAAAKKKAARKPASQKPAATKAPHPKRPRGRPSAYTPELAQQILDMLSKGIPLAIICRSEGMPATRTVSDWKKAHEGFSAEFARARDEGFDAIAAQCLEIADDERHDWVMSKKGPLVAETAIGRARLQVEARLKLLAKWDPKRYGDKVQIGGADDLPPIGVVDMSDEALAAIAAGVARGQ